MRPGFLQQLSEELIELPVSESPRSEVVNVDIQIPLEVPTDRGAVLLYEREERKDSPSGIPIAFWNSSNTAR